MVAMLRPSSPAHERWPSPAFAAAKFYAAAIPAITRMSDKRRAVLHLLKMLRTALSGY